MIFRDIFTNFHLHLLLSVKLHLFFFYIYSSIFLSLHLFLSRSFFLSFFLTCILSSFLFLSYRLFSFFLTCILHRLFSFFLTCILHRLFSFFLTCILHRLFSFFLTCILHRLFSFFLSYMHITSSFLFLFFMKLPYLQKKASEQFFEVYIFKIKDTKNQWNNKWQKKLWWSFYCGICAFIERAYFLNFRNSLRIKSLTIWAKERRTKVKIRAIFVMDLKFLGNAVSFIYQTYWRQHQ